MESDATPAVYAIRSAADPIRVWTPADRTRVAPSATWHGPEAFWQKRLLELETP